MLRTLASRSEPLQLLQLRHVYRCLTNLSCSCARAPFVLASKAEQLTAAVPGTVKEYEHHILIQTAPLKSDTAAKDCHALHGCWWPSVVEKHPAVIQAVAAAAKAQTARGGNVKVTTYEEATRDTFAEAGRPVCDLRIYPAGMQYSNLPIEKVSQVTSAHVLYEAATSEDSQAEQQNASLKLDEALLQLQQPIHGVQLLVCCHGSRDTRCGTIGNELVTVLDDLIHQRQLQDKVEVLKCSHVGGHKYAGNVLVYGPVTPCDGDWFGGVNKSNAADFFDAVINAEIGGDGGAEEPALRHLWRGKMRMNKQQQLDLFAGLAEDSETDSDDDGETESRLPAKVFAADQHQELQASPAACDMYSSSLGGGSQLAADHDCCCSQGVTAPDDTHPETDGDSSTSDDESSSSSSSDESSDSDGDPDLPPPVQVAQTKVVVS